MKKFLFRTASLALFVFTSCLVSAQINLDAGFGDQGIARFGFSRGRLTDFRFLTVQGNEKVVAFAELWASERSRTVMVRFQADGQLDATFGDGGYVRLFAGGPPESAAGLFLLPDGRLETAVWVYQGGGLRLKIRHWTADGAPDVAFGEIVSDVLTEQGYPEKLLRQPDGWLALGIKAYEPLANTELFDVFVAQLRANGTLDPAFGQNGVQVLDYDQQVDAPADMEQMPDGKIFVLAQSGSGLGTNYFVRLLPDGQFDPTFGWFADGYQYFATGFSLKDITVRDNDWLYLAGATTFYPEGPCVYRVSTANVQRDESFGAFLGRALVPTGLPATFETVVPLPDGGLIAAGTYYGQTGLPRQVIARFNAEGRFETTYGDSSGYTLLGSATLGSVLQAAALTPSGKLMTASIAQSSGGELLSGGLVRLTAEGKPDPAFNGGQMALHREPLGDDFVHGVQVLPDGALLVNGTSEGDFFNPTLLQTDAQGQRQDVFGGPEGLGLPFPGQYYVGGLNEAMTLPNGYRCFAGVKTAGNRSYAQLYSVLPDGTANTAFGQQGVAQIELDERLTNVYYTDCLLQTDGRILIFGGGLVPDAFPQQLMFFARFLPDGQPDESFGENGTQTVFLSDNAYAAAMAQQVDGKIAVLAFSDVTTMFRLQPSGAIDFSFGEDGVARLFFGGVPYRQEAAMAVLPNGSLAVVCQTSNANSSGLSIVPPNGLDPFSVQLSQGGEYGLAGDIAVLPYGKIVFAVNVRDADGFEQTKLYRRLSNGDADPSGTAVLPTAPAGRRTTALAVQPDGKVVLAGSEFDGFSQNAFLARLSSDFEIEATDVFDSGLRLALAPNPVRDVLFVRFELTQPETLRGELWNAAGQYLGVVFDLQRPAGKYEEAVRLPALPAGVYALRVTGDRGEKRVLGLVVR